MVIRGEAGATKTVAVHGGAARPALQGL